MNPVDFLKRILNRNVNPEQILGNMIRNNNNPMFSNLIKMAQEGNSKGVENFARNIFKEQGRDFDKEFSDFRNKLK